MKEGWEKRIGAIRCCRSDGRRRNQAGHLRKGNGHSSTIVKEDGIWKICLVLQGIRDVDGIRDVHKCTWDKHVGNEINMLYLGARWALFFKLGVVVAEKAAKQTTLVFYGWIGQARKTIGVKAVAVQLVVLLVTWIIHQECIWCRGAADDDAVNWMCLMLGPLDITAFCGGCKLTKIEEPMFAHHAPCCGRWGLGKPNNQNA
jgi:hypothetical protein